MPIKELKNLLEGTKVLKISESKCPESIGRFQIERDEQLIGFTLCATDLGFWVCNVERSGQYVDMTDMLDSIYNHVCECKKTVHNKTNEDIIKFECCCGEEFLILRKRMGKYKDILKDDENLEKISKLLSEGAWFSGPSALYVELNLDRLKE